MLNFLIIWLVSIIILMFIWASVGKAIKGDDEAQRLNFEENKRQERIKSLYPKN